MKKNSLKNYCSVVLASVFIAGCAGFGEPGQYNGIKANEFSHGGKSWYVFDNTGGSKILTKPGGFGRSLTLGLFSSPDRSVENREAAQAYLNSKGRTNCIVIDTTKLSDDSYQNTYGCA